jgi:hypothetical protein
VDIPLTSTKKNSAFSDSPNGPAPKPLICAVRVKVVVVSIEGALRRYRNAGTPFAKLPGVLLFQLLPLKAEKVKLCPIVVILVGTILLIVEDVLAPVTQQQARIKFPGVVGAEKDTGLVVTVNPSDGLVAVPEPTDDI